MEQGCINFGVLKNEPEPGMPALAKPRSDRILPGWARWLADVYKALLLTQLCWGMQRAAALMNSSAQASITCSRMQTWMWAAPASLHGWPAGQANASAAHLCQAADCSVNSMQSVCPCMLKSVYCAGQNTTEKMIRKQLEAELGVDLSERRQFIRQQVKSRAFACHSQYPSGHVCLLQLPAQTLSLISAPLHLAC